MWDGRRLHLRARSGNDITAKYPELTRVDAGLGPEPARRRRRDRRARREGTTELHASAEPHEPRQAARDRARGAAHAGALLPLRRPLARRDGCGIASPSRERREHPRDASPQDAIAPIVLPPVFDDVDAALAGARNFGLEGVVVKDPSSAYRRGRPVRVVAEGEAHPHAGGRDRRDPPRPRRADGIDRLAAARHPGPGRPPVRGAGRVGLQRFDARAARPRCSRRCAPTRTRSSGSPPPMPRDALWVRPEVVGEVEFAEFTPDGILRHSRWRGLRPDKAPDEVVARGLTSCDRDERSSRRRRCAGAIRRARRARRGRRARAGTSSARRRSARRGSPAAFRGSRPTDRR